MQGASPRRRSTERGQRRQQSRRRRPGSPGRLSISCSTVMDLVQQAYVTFANGRRHPPELRPIEGGPAWINSDRYTIDAKAASPQSQEMMKGPMLQALLEERFALKIHADIREVPVYSLVVRKGGPRLQRAKDGDCVPFDFVTPLEPGQKPCGVPMTGVKGPNLTTEMVGSLVEFSKVLGATLDRPVIDRTGVAGVYDFRLEYAIDGATPGVRPASSDDPAGASIFAAIREQLALKLEPGKGPGEFLVIDHVERPTQN
jgi:uncharacterized protein (TIGR03435 family)